MEFGADDAFILSPDRKAADVVVLRHLKARHTEPHDLTLQFNRKRQLFTPTTTTTSKPKADGKLQSALAKLWDKTDPVADTEPGGR